MQFKTFRKLIESYVLFKCMYIHIDAMHIYIVQNTCQMIVWYKNLYMAKYV